MVITTYNRREALTRALESAKIQTFPSFEIIVVNDYVKDNEYYNVQNEACDDVTFLNSLGLGGNGARMRGVSVSKGKFVAFLDDDDIWHPHKLLSQHEIFVRHPNKEVVSCYAGIERDGQNGGVILTTTNERLLRCDNFFGGFSFIMVRRSIFQECPLDSQIARAQDWEFYLNILKNYGSDVFGIYPDFLLTYQVSSGLPSITSTVSIDESWGRIGERYSLTSDMLSEFLFYKSRNWEKLPLLSKTFFLLVIHKLKTKWRSIRF